MSQRHLLTWSLPLAVGAALAASPWARAQPETPGFPAPPDVSILSLLPAQKTPSETKLPPDATAEAHVAALKRDPNHGKRFWVERIEGNPHAKNVVFLLPQYHRNPSMPIGWTSLGAAIAEVQDNIDVLLTRLFTTHRLSCIGTEGSADERIVESAELNQLAWWNHDLERTMQEAMANLAKVDADRAREPMQIVVDVMREAIREQARLLDGVGMAQARLGEPLNVYRFGVEDAALNHRALRILRELRDVEQELATLDPSSQTAFSDAMAELWLEEFPAYERTTIKPLEDSLLQLDELRKELRYDDAEYQATVIGRFVALARRSSDSVIQPTEIFAQTAYYKEVKAKEKALADGGDDAKVKKKKRVRLSAADRARSAELKKRLSKLQRRYRAVTHDARERVAAERTLERLRSLGVHSCALVMGASHEEGLVKELQKVGERKLRKNELAETAVVVISATKLDEG